MEHDLGVFLVQFGAVVVALSVLARVARGVGLSPIPLYLLAGLAFGEGGAFDLGAAEEFIEVGAEIGVILLLLMLGLEFSAQELVRNVRRDASSGALDALLNFPPGLIAGLLLGWDLETAALLGGVTYISSSGVVAKLLADLGRIGNRETPTVLTILVIEDLAMAVYLPLMAGFLIGDDLTATLQTVVVAVGIVVGVVLVALRWGHRIGRMVMSGSSEVLLLSIFGTTLVVAGLAEQVELSAAVGAFLVGITLSGPAASEGRELLLPLRNLFAAVFFVFFGMSVDPSLIADVFWIGAALAVVTAATKLVTGWYAAARSGIGVRGRVRAGAALVARGEFSIVIAAIGGTVEPDLAALAAAYVVILAVSGPVIARAADWLASLLIRPAPEGPGASEPSVGR